MKNKNYTELSIIEFINTNTMRINEILAAKIFNSQTLKELINAYNNLYSFTNDIKYKKNIAEIYYFYFNQKEKALETYLEYTSKIKNDSSVYHIISDLYKSLKDNDNYKKYLELALSSADRNIPRPIPHSEDLVLGINIGVAAGLSMNDDIKHGLDIYKKIMQYSPIPNNIITPYIDLELKKANELFQDKKWQEAMIKYKNIFNHSSLQEADFINLITCLAELKETELAMEYLRMYEETTEDKDRANYVIADLLYFKFNKIEESIERFEKYILKNTEDALIYNTLGHLYSVLYNDKFLDKQLDYFLKAHKLNPNSRTFTRNVALIYNKLGQIQEAKQYYKRLLKINPTHDDYFDYACMLIQNAEFNEGYKLFTHRFQKENKPALYPPMLPPDKELLESKDISNNTILVQCEQGFGDTIMYTRFVVELAKQAKKVIFIVQNELVDLFKSSNLGVEVLGINTDYSLLDYDYHLPIMNLPIILKTQANNLPHTDKYLSVNKNNVEHFAYEFISNPKKIKIGLAYEGHNVSQELNRDIKLTEFLPILQMDNVDVYILQHEDTNKQIENLPKECNIINIGKDFTTFEDTAAALKNMDLVITTDNVILNLAGALGIKTYGLFNKFTEYRWFDLTKDHVGWYKSVKPYQTKEIDNWTDIILQIKKELSKK